MRQKQPLGLGHAVLCAREVVGDQAVAVLLGDDLIDNDAEPGIGQLIRVHEATGAGAIALMEVEAGREHMYGIVAGDPFLLEQLVARHWVKEWAVSSG